MDSSFTEHVLERARERQRKLQESSHQYAPLREANLILDKVTSSLSQPNLAEFKKPLMRKDVVSDSSLSTKVTDPALKENCSEGRVETIVRQNSSTKITSALPSSPQPQLKTLNIERDNFNMEIKLISSEHVRVEVEIQDSDNSDNDVGETAQIIETPGLREQAKSRLRKLGKLYAGGEDADISSPIQRTEAKFLSEILTPPDEPGTSCSNLKSKKGLRKLADLAQNISEWEDNLSHPRMEKEGVKTSVKQSWKPPAPQPPTPASSSPAKVSKVKQQAPQPPKSKGAASKQLKWDKTVLESLESQGFTRTTSSSRLVYNYDSAETIGSPAEKLINDRQTPKVNEEAETNDDKKANDNRQTAKTNQSESSKRESVLPKQGINLKSNKNGSEITDKSKPASPLQKLITAKKFAPLNSNLEEQKLTPRSPIKSRSSAIANKAAMFESSPTTTNKDPAVLTIAEKKALFEKNKGTALLPKAAFAMATPIKENAQIKKKATPVIKDNSTITKKATAIVKDNSPIMKKTTLNDSLPVKKKATPIKTETGGIASKIAALIESKNITIAQEQIETNIKEQRQKEMEVLMNRFNRNKNVNAEEAAETTPLIIEEAVQIVTTPTSDENRTDNSDSPPPGEKRRSGEKRTKKSDSPHVAAVLEDVKRIRVSQPKEGKLYPCLSDIETATETYSNEESFCSEEGGADTSFGREILQAVCKNQTPQKRPIYEEESLSDQSDILDDTDNYLDEAMASDFSSNGPTPPKIGKVTPPSANNLTRPSDSFHYKNCTPKKGVNSPAKILPTHVVDGDDVLPLTHTVSFYRKQQSQVKTPVRQISHQAIAEETKIDTGEDEVVERKIQELLDEVNRHQMIISQTSQALNLCNATPEFVGSTEQVEAEKVLLLATHRRQACLNEIQRLRVEKTLRPLGGQHSQNVPLEKGTLILNNIILPLKREYVRALAAAGGKGHHVVCLIKYGEQVLATHLVSTVASSSKNPDQELRIPGSIRLENIFSDFAVTFEVYCLQAQEEVLPHEVKYHINKKTTSKLTPKKGKQESRMIRPPMESPAGPNAVRTSTFALMGFVVFSIQAINKKHWTLNKAPSMSPLEGSVEMKISCELSVSVEYKGFLTMFEDVSGMGAWHRRWCFLNGNALSYWKYPDDEKKKPPIDSISLRNVITDKVGPVSRDICARLHTFMIERERMEGDKESLVVIRRGNKTIIRHLLSADTKEERVEWCDVFNRALTGLRMWGN